jgi:hypothetical protein
MIPRRTSPIKNAQYLPDLLGEWLSHIQQPIDVIMRSEIAVTSGRGRLMLVSRTTRAATLAHNFSALLPPIPTTWPDDTEHSGSHVKQTIPLELAGSVLDLRDSKQNDFN